MCSLVKLFKQFPTNESCVDFLEKKRFKDGYYCTYCGSKKVSKHSEKSVEVVCNVVIA